MIWNTHARLGSWGRFYSVVLVQAFYDIALVMNGQKLDNSYKDNCSPLWLCKGINVNKICCRKSWCVSSSYTYFRSQANLSCKKTQNIELNDIIILWSNFLLQGHENCNWNECSTKHVMKGTVRRLKELRHAISCNKQLHKVWWRSTVA